jgi:hypothetical protein
VVAEITDDIEISLGTCVMEGGPPVSVLSMYICPCRSEQIFYDRKMSVE